MLQITLQRRKNFRTLNITSDMRQVRVDCDLPCMASAAIILNMSRDSKTLISSWYNTISIFQNTNSNVWNISGFEMYIFFVRFLY